MFEYHKKESPIISLLGMGGGIGSYIFTAADTGYEIARSLRFDSSSSAYLSKTFDSAGNRKTWTWAGWIKRSKISDSVDTQFFSAGTSGASNLDAIGFTTADTINFYSYNGSFVYLYNTSAVFRDTSAWYHVVAVLDTTNATSTDRVRLYVNGVRVTDFASSTAPSQNADGGHINTTNTHYTGKFIDITQYFNGYLADVWFIDGSALEPTEFGTFDDYGIWQPKRYTGSKSGNSFHLPFSDNTSATTLGYDDSGNNNNWDVSGISITEGNGNYGGTSSGYITNPINALDGDITTYASAFPSGNSGDYIFDNAITRTGTLKVYTLQGSGTGFIFYPEEQSYLALKVDGTWNTVNASSGWSGDLSSFGTSVEGFRLYADVGSGSPGLTAIEINGITLIDNSFGSANDSLLDSPQNADTTTTEDTGVGGEIKGNYATLNPLDSTATLSNGNLDMASGSWVHGLGTIHITSGKWYFEALLTSFSGAGALMGFTKQGNANVDAFRIIYEEDGRVMREGTGISNTTGLTTYGAGDLIGASIDMDAGEIKFYKNGTLINTTTNAVISSTAWRVIVKGDGAAWSANFGQRAFAYQAPSGFKALNTANLSTPTIEDGSQYVGVTTYTGNNSTQTISGLGFSPDFVWIKSRNSGDWHHLFDTVRGATKYLNSNDPASETTNANTITSFDSTGFSLGSYPAVNGSSKNLVAWTWDAGSNSNKTYTVTVPSGTGGGFYIDGDQKPTINLEEGSTYTFDQSDSSNSGHPFRFSETSDGTHGSGTEYTTNVTTFGTPGSAGAYTRIEVAASAPTLYYYCSNHSAMGGQINTNSTAGASNFDGSIASVVRANPTAGFSIVTYTSNVSSNQTVGHGLNAAPHLVIVKNRDDGGDPWAVYTKVTGKDKYLYLNTTARAESLSEYWGSAEPTSTVFGVGAGLSNNRGTDDMVAYCWAPVEGYSAFGSYVGGDSNPKFVYTGFRPKFILVKETSSNSYPDNTGWYIWDSVRGAYNYNQLNLTADSSNQEGLQSGGGAIGTIGVDMLSNGFCLRGNGDAATNWSGGTYVYAAFAEHPFRSSRAR